MHFAANREATGKAMQPCLLAGRASPSADNPGMRIPFTKMQGAGNDFVVLDETRQRYSLSAAQYRFLGDRHFGIGADQILTVRPSPSAGIDFEYLIHNADGQEVEHCGNGARCFLKFVQEQHLTDKTAVSVKTMNRVLDLCWDGDAKVRVDMGAPQFDPARVPFVPPDPLPQRTGAAQLWKLPLDQVPAEAVRLAVVSMGNPHAVLVVEDVAHTDVPGLGAAIQRQGAFPEGVNVGFMQIVSRKQIQLRVYERGAGETLACGTGACAAAVAGMQLGLLERRVDVRTRGGPLGVEWAGGSAPVLLSGPATTVFSGEIDLPDDL